MRLKPDASFSQVQKRLPQIAQQMWPGKPPGTVYSLEIVRLDEAHSYPPLNPDLRPRLLVMTAVSVLILLVSCINFINLITARSALRAKEVAVRKTVARAAPPWSSNSSASRWSTSCWPRCSPLRWPSGCFPTSTPLPVRGSLRLVEEARAPGRCRDWCHQPRRPRRRLPGFRAHRSSLSASSEA